MKQHTMQSVKRLKCVFRLVQNIKMMPIKKKNIYIEGSHIAAVYCMRIMITTTTTIERDTKNLDLRIFEPYE